MFRVSLVSFSAFLIFLTPSYVENGWRYRIADQNTSIGGKYVVHTRYLYAHGTCMQSTANIDHVDQYIRFVAQQATPREMIPGRYRSVLVRTKN